MIYISSIAEPMAVDFLFALLGRRQCNSISKPKLIDYLAILSLSPCLSVYLPFLLSVGFFPKIKTPTWFALQCWMLLVTVGERSEQHLNSLSLAQWRMGEVHMCWLNIIYCHWKVTKFMSFMITRRIFKGIAFPGILPHHQKI